MSRRLSALVIGNAAYETVAELKNPANDAEDVAEQLEASGFSVIQEADCNHAEMDRALWALQHRPCSISKFGTGLAALHPELPAHRWRPVLHRQLRAEELTS